MKNGIPHLIDITELFAPRGFKEHQVIELIHADGSRSYQYPAPKEGGGYWTLTPYPEHDATFLSVHFWGDEEGCYEDASIVFSATSDGVVERVTFSEQHTGSHFPEGEEQAIPTNDAELDQLILKFRSDCITYWEAYK